MICKSGFALVAALALSCSDYGPSHDLVHLSGVKPNVVESGDMLQVLGSGFVEGSPARISFRGDIYRPGEAPRRNVEIVVRTKDTSKDRITFAVTDELEAAFCGVGANASHAAFHGAITLAFAAGSDALAPVSGTLRGVRLEVMPKGRTMQAERERQQLSHEALQFLGLDLIDDGASDCCTVANARGRALLAGIKPGDRLVEFDGVPVRAPTDLVPAGRNRMATVWVRRDDATRPLPRSIDVQGFRWSIPSELAAAFGVLLLALGFIFGLNSHIRGLFGSLTGAAARIFPIHSTPARSRGARLGVFKGLLADLPLPEFAALRVVQVFSVIALGGLCAAVSLRRELVSGELDLILWWLVSSIAVSVATLIAQLRSERCVVRSLLFAVRALTHQLPLLVVIALAMVATHSPRISEIVRAQGPWPNLWLIFHDPAFAVASILAMGALVPVADAGVRPALAWARPGSVSSATAGDGTSANALLIFLIARVHLWIQSILLAILLFGGWAVASDHAGDKHVAWPLLPALVLLAKTWVVITCLSFARSMLRSLTYRHTTPWVLKVVFPLSLLCGSLSFLWTWSIHQWSLSWAGESLRWVMLTAFVALTSFLALRVQRRIRSRPRASLENYWT